MGLGDSGIFTFKSRATQERESEEYAIWAFPYGQLQRDRLEKLLLEIYPKESIPTTLVPFLTCKELYEGILKKTGSSVTAIDTMINTQKQYKLIIRKKTMTMYLALVLADAAIDEKCEYPSADEIKAKAEELELLRKKK